MTTSKPKSSLSLVNFITGMSDGMLMPYGICLVLMPLFAVSFSHILLVASIVLILGALVFGWARYSGEKTEIEHHHPQLASEEAAKEKELMLAIGIDRILTDDMQSQMEEERNLWLREVLENEMGWERKDNFRALKSALETASGFFIGGAFIFIALFISLHVWRQPFWFIVLALLLVVVFGMFKGFLVGKSVLTITSIQLLLALGITASAFVISYVIPLGNVDLWHLLTH